MVAFCFEDNFAVISHFLFLISMKT
jgi:hypothetical protein